MKEKLLISACLCGKNTKYSGGNNYTEKLKQYTEGKIILTDKNINYIDNVDDYQGNGWQHNWKRECNATIVWDN